MATFNKNVRLPISFQPWFLETFLGRPSMQDMSNQIVCLAVNLLSGRSLFYFLRSKGPLQRGIFPKMPSVLFKFRHRSLKLFFFGCSGPAPLDSVDFSSNIYYQGAIFTQVIRSYLMNGPVSPMQVCPTSI